MDVDDDGAQVQDGEGEGAGEAEGMLVRDWIERALIHDLARTRKEQVRSETDLSDSRRQHPVH